MRHPTIVPIPAHADPLPGALPSEIAGLAAIARKPRLTPVKARLILAGGALCGVLGDLFFQEGPAGGVGTSLYICAFAACIGGLAPSAIKALPLRVSGLLAAGVAFALLLLYRNSEVLSFANAVAAMTFLTIASALAKPGATLSLSSARIRDLLGLVPMGVVETATGAPRFLFGDARAAFLGADGESRSNTIVAVVRAIAIALFLTVGFALLLSGGDPVFRSLVAWPERWNALELPEHVLRLGFFAWPVLGLMWSTTRPSRTDSEDVLSNAITLNRLDVVTALGAMNALFAVYVLLQLRVLFGGSAYVLQTTGLTVAQYARDGFFALAFAAALVLGVLLAINALLREDRLGAWKVSRRMSGSLLVMVGLMMVSATTRMMLYVQAFGISIDRVIALAIMAWLAMVAGWFVLTVLRERATRFVIGAMAAGSATLFALNVINPEAIVVRSQMQRAERGGEFDAVYANQQLGSDAAPALVGALRAGLVPRTSVAGTKKTFPSCEMAKTLLTRWGPEAAADLGSWTVSEQQASWTVARNQQMLLQQCENAN